MGCSCLLRLLLLKPLAILAFVWLLFAETMEYGVFALVVFCAVCGRLRHDARVFMQLSFLLGGLALLFFTLHAARGPQITETHLLRTFESNPSDVADDQRLCLLGPLLLDGSQARPCMSRTLKGEWRQDGWDSPLRSVQGKPDGLRVWQHTDEMPNNSTMPSIEGWQDSKEGMHIHLKRHRGIGEAPHVRSGRFLAGCVLLTATALVGILGVWLPRVRREPDAEV